MWISEKLAQNKTPVQNTAASVSFTDGGTASLMTGGEARGIPMYSCGGVVWRPKTGDGMLVFKTAGSGEICALTPSDPSQVAPGEVMLQNGNASVYIKNDGTVHITGTLFINGVRYSEDG